MKRITTYKLKLKPTAAQANRFEKWLGVCRFIYNLALETKSYAYQKARVTISKSELQTEVKLLAKKYDWIGDLHSQVRQDPLVRLEKAYKSFFREIKKGNRYGHPKFQKKRDYKSFTFPQNVKFVNGKLSLPGIGLVNLYHGNRDLSAIKIKQGTIIKESSGWFISITGEVDAYHLNKNNSMIGIDLGVANYYATSDGELIENPKLSKKYFKKMALLQRSAARKKKHSSRQKKVYKKIAGLHEKIARCRRTFQHTQSFRLVRDNQAIAVEALQFKNMTRSARGTIEEPGRKVKQKAGLNRSLTDVAGASFFGMLEYKCSWYGRTFVKVNPRGTSQECAECGHTHADNRLSQSQFLCTSCGHKSHADTNAAINIKGRAFPSGDISGVTCEPEKPRL